MTPRKHTVAFVVALAAMVALAIALQVARDRAFAYTTIDRPVMYVTDPEVMRRAALSYDTLLADVYWIRALQHYGGERQKRGPERRYDLLYPLLDLTTTLDPRFNIAYRFGAIFLAEPHPGGAGHPDQAIALLKKGIVLNPSKWEYYQDIGFIYYWHLRDYEQAADWFERGGNLAGSPFWLKSWAAVMLTRGGNREASRALWTQIGQSEENDWLRKMSQIRLLQLDALDEIDVLKRFVDSFTKATGRHPRSWEQLVAAHAMRRIPVDPSGTPYVLDEETGDIGVAQDSPLWPLPTEPAAAPELKSQARPVPR
jgi:tetratricopeptide (TPR) repeat protein